MIDAASDVQGGSAALLQELARLRELEGIAIEFCERCRTGAIRSSYTYHRFRAVLSRAADGSGAGTSQETGASGR